MADRDFMRFMNRLLVKSSGGRRRNQALVIHVGRTSGRQYRNPVAAFPLADGFVIPVVFGTHSNWVQNITVADQFTLRTMGEDVPLKRPEIISREQALAAFPRLIRPLVKAKKRTEFLFARRVT